MKKLIFPKDFKKVVAVKISKKENMEDTVTEFPQHFKKVKFKKLSNKEIQEELINPICKEKGSQCIDSCNILVDRNEDDYEIEIQVCEIKYVWRKSKRRQKTVGLYVKPNKRRKKSK